MAVAAGPAFPSDLAGQCETISEFWVSQWGCHQLSMLREHGAEVLAAFKQRLLRRHQRDYFLPGLDKLGIARNLPPAVIAARYHYFSNMLGGLKMEYIEESPKRVWIRYLAPSYSFTGISLAAVPGKVQRSMFSGWHPFNGLSLGRPQLGFVVTKVFQDGEPYDEGYFEEFDEPLAEDQRIRFRPVTTSPDYDPAKAPRLDEAVWPADRRAKALRNFSRGFFEDSIRANLELYGVNSSAATLAQSMRIFAIQFFGEYRKRYGFDVHRAADLVAFFAALCEIANEPFSVETPDNRTFRVRRANRMLAGDRAPHEIFFALSEFMKLCAKVASARIKVDLVSVEHGEDGLAHEVWEFSDTEERLF